MKYVYFPVLLLLVISLPLRGDHWVGGNISYKYFSAPHVYEVKLTLIKESSGVAAGSTAELFYSSSCFAKDSISLTLQPGFTVVSDGYCLGGKTSEIFEAYEYIGLVSLDGICNDWVFSFQSCCRHIGISNISFPYNRPIYLDAHLNNSLGPNNSAVFQDLDNQTFCYSPTGKINYLHAASDDDLDSLYYKFSDPLEAENNPIIYASGFDANNPVSSNPPAKLNFRTGNMRFKPVNIELDIVKIEVEEYRLDVSNNSYVKVGSVNKEFLLPIAPYCSDKVMFWELSSRTDAINKVLKYHCRDTVLRFHTTRKYQKESVALDGSDFMVIDGLNNKKIKRVKTVDEYTIEIHLTDSIKKNGNFYLVIKEGLDTNSIENYCGFQMLTDSLKLKHMGCSEVSIAENSLNNFQYYPNPVNDILNMTWPLSETTEVTISDLSGRTIKTLQLNDAFSYQWNLEWLPAGLYNLTYKSEYGSRRTLIFKE